MLESPGDLEIEVAESLLGVPAIPAEALQNRQQLNIPDPLNPVSSHQESFTSTTTDGNKPTNEFTEKTINVAAKFADRNAKDKMETVKNREYGCQIAKQFIM